MLNSAVLPNLKKSLSITVAFKKYYNSFLSKVQYLFLILNYPREETRIIDNKANLTFVFAAFSGKPPIIKIFRQGFDLSVKILKKPRLFNVSCGARNDVGSAAVERERLALHIDSHASRLVKNNKRGGIVPEGEDFFKE